MPEETVTLYRAVREHEIAVIDELRFRAFPPRRETYPYSDPTHDEAQARRLTENMMNRLGMKQSCILDFEMKKEFADQLKIDLHDEVLKVENLTELNLNAEPEHCHPYRCSGPARSRWHARKNTNA